MNAEKCQAFQRSRKIGECFDSKEIVCDLGKLWPFGMEGAEVALERSQEREEMGEWGHENGGKKDVCSRAGMDNEMNKATPDQLVWPPWSLVLRNSPKPVNQRD